MTRPKALVSWSTGKDSAYALHTVRQQALVEVVGIVTTVSATFGRVSMHGVREVLLERQVAELGLPCVRVAIPTPCSMEGYEREMARAMEDARQAGVMHVVFGDLFLEDLRAHRESKLAEIGMQGVFPLWHRDTAALAREMVAAGVRATLTCIDPRKMDKTFAGRAFDAALLEEFPREVDPCGENGEFHTFVSAGPMFMRPIHVRAGEVVERDGFVFADLLPQD